MKVGIIGANSQVGTELCFLLDAEGVDVVPITRNVLGAATFGHHDIGYRTGDIADPSDAESILPDLDVVVIAAFAYYVSRGELMSKTARKTNEALVRNASKYSGDDAQVIYFSSIAAFGSEVRDTDWWWYTREKRHIEDYFYNLQHSTERKYVFRLGHVFGPNQDITDELQRKLAKTREIYVAAEEDRKSNIVHTTTIADAILTVSEEQYASDRYTVVNEPNWTWSDVIDYYSPDLATVTFHGSNDDTSASKDVIDSLRNLIVKGYQSLPVEESNLLSATVYSPQRFDNWVEDSTKKRKAASEIAEIRSNNLIHMGMFDYDPVPGDFINGLSNTRERLEEQDPIPLLMDEKYSIPD